MDGWITIGTKIDNSGFDKGAKALENKIDRIEDDVNDLSNLKINGVPFEEFDESAENTKRKVSELKQEIKEVENTVARTSGAGFVQYDTSSIQSFVENYESATMKASRLKEETKQMKEEQRLAKQQIREQEKATRAAEKAERQRRKEAERTQRELQKGTGNNIRQLGRMALAVLGIRSAYLLVRQASSTLSQYDEQYAANLEYIRYVIAQGIAPFLRYIVNLAGTLLNYLGTILNAWFGISTMTNASANAFVKAKNNLGAGAKSAKEIKNSLAGFDEMNVMQDSSSSSGGAGGAVKPDFSIGDMGGETPAWLRWIADNGPAVVGTIIGIVAGIKAFGLVTEKIKALGVGLLFGGIAMAIGEIAEYLKDPSWENFGGIIQGVGTAVIGLGILIGSTPAIIAGAIILIIGTIVKYWEQIKGFLQGGIDWLTGQSDWIRDMFGDGIGDIYDFIVRTLQRILNVFDSIFTSIKGVFDGLIMFISGVFSGDWKKAWEGVKKIFSSIWDGIKGVFKNVMGFLLDMLDTVTKTIGRVLSFAFKAVVNGALSMIENLLNAPIRAINGLLSLINAIPGVNVPRIPTMKLPRLATGGIINMPNRGVMLGGAIAGESGAEGVIPLTDSQAMETLGEAIGRYITINANIVNSMNGRIISKELQRIRGQQDFAYNS